MGIKFLCPSGHKLHVKEFLAGKKALCPKCGARVVVPEASETESVDEAGLASMDLSEMTGTRPATSKTGESAAVAVWYVRPESGGQYGPATSDVLRGWLDEKRIGPGSMVWRDDWPEWKSASVVFPEIAASATTSAETGLADKASGPSAEGPIASQPVAVSDAPKLPKNVRRRKQNDASVIASAILAGISIILIVVLFLVITQQSGSSGNASGAKPAADAP